MRINGIRDARNLRADQTIKVLKGPFNVRIYSSEFRLDVYLQDLYLRSYRVALGADQGTPMGVWRVKERLDNPHVLPLTVGRGQTHHRRQRSGQPARRTLDRAGGHRG